MANAETYAKRFNELKKMVNDLRPTSLAGFASILPASDMRTLQALRDLGHFMICEETGRCFAPDLCVRG